MIDHLHYISRAAADGTHLSAIEKVLISGVKWVQLRIKEQPEQEILLIAIEAARLCEKYKAKLIINDYPKIALAAGAYGVHLGLTDMPIPEARALMGKDTCIGGTANTFADMLQRAQEGVDYIGLGPFRYSTTKKNLSPVLGIEGYRRLMAQARQAGIDIPIIAIGGIQLSDIPVLIDTGIAGVAVSAALEVENELQERVEAFYNYFRPARETKTPPKVIQQL